MNFDFDHSVKLMDDFYSYVNKKWIDSNDIPDDYNILNSFNIVHEQNYEKIKRVILETPLNEEFSKVHTVYTQSMNLNRHSEIKSYIERINNVKDKHELRRLVIDMFTLFNIKHFNFFNVNVDSYDSNMNILMVHPVGFGLPDRDYYINSMNSDKLDKYKEFILLLGNLFNIKFNAHKIIEFEKELAKVSYSNTERRDITLLNNYYIIGELKQTYPLLYDDIKYYFEQLSVSFNKELKINIFNPKFTKIYYETFMSVDLDLLKQIYIFIFLRKYGSYINFDAEKILFDFYQKYMSGVVEMKPLWKRTLHILDSYVGMILGKMYVAMYFPEDIKEKVKTMVQYIKSAFEERLYNNTWMDDITKQKALSKLHKMNIKIGYPDKWTDYTDMNVNCNNDLLQNILNISHFHYMDNAKNLYNNVDKTKWFMNPHEINAYYSHEFNEIVFPAGILTSPFFDNTIDMAYNFGSIGCIIGHEITHGFDDMGRKFDQDGNLIDWWTPNSEKNYKIKTESVKKMYSILQFQNVNINGELTLGENIADLGGVMIAYHAMLSYYGNMITTDIKKNFFYSYANLWKSKIRPEEALKRLKTDTHSPPYYRVNTILSNINDFYECFNITDKDKMWMDKDKRVVIW